MLKLFDGFHDRLITTYQVEMEFKRNRQAVIAQFLKNLQHREKVQHSAFLAESKAAEVLGNRIADVNKRIDRLRRRLRMVLKEPTKHDPVYKVVQRLFTNDTALNLNRSNKTRHAIKRRAFRRFLLGYPPRKTTDTSMGDALNWEWLIEVAKDTGADVAIVSRDSDFGIDLDGQPMMNDWLVQEFRDRVSRKRKCVLCNRLAAAFKLAKISVTKEAEAQEEEELAQEIERTQGDPPDWAQRARSAAPRTWPEGSLGWLITNTVPHVQSLE